MACIAHPPSVWAILTYDGARLDIVINYVVAAVMLSATAVATVRRPAGRQHALAFAAVALVAVIAFQLGLCACLGCTGISIVWNAAVGYALVTDLQGPLGRRMLLAAMAACALADVYYAATADSLTTIAHGCALLLGALLGGLYVCAAAAAGPRQRGAWLRLGDGGGSSSGAPSHTDPLARTEAASAAHPANGVLHAQAVQRLRQLTATIPPVVLEPAAFFVAWQGVLVLAWRGFPPPLASLKAELESSASSGALGVRLAPEGGGSKWPKTSLGALNDAAPPLSLDQLKALKQICEEHGARLRARKGATVGVDSLAAVTYAQRSLETLRTSVVLPLVAGTGDKSVSAGVTSSAVSEAEAARVETVLREWDDEAAYLPHVNKPRARISSYREASGTGATLVAFLGGEVGGTALKSESLPRALAEFRAAVDASLPGVYAWLDEPSLHCTVRALDPLAQ